MPRKRNSLSLRINRSLKILDRPLVSVPRKKTRVFDTDTPEGEAAWSAVVNAPWRYEVSEQKLLGHYRSRELVTAIRVSYSDKEDLVDAPAETEPKDLPTPLWRTVRSDSRGILAPLRGYFQRP